MRQPRILIISSNRWPIPARIGLALAHAGFAVAAISPRRSFVAKTHAIERLYSYQIGSHSSSIIAAIENWSPDLLVCTDDPSVNALHRLYSDAVRSASTEQNAKLLALIEKSVGNPASFKFTSKKSNLLHLAQSLGVRCPSTTFVSNKDLESLLHSVAYPVLVKADGSWGGKFVRLVANARQARATICEFRLPSSWPTILRQFLSNFIGPSILNWQWRELPTIGLQQFVAGSPANRAVLCWKGRVLAGVSLRVHKTVYTFGPASLVEIINSPEMSEAAEKLVQRLELSGMIGFDFILDAAGRAWLIEMNPRVTPACYLGRCGADDLSSFLFSEMTGSQAPPNITALGKRIALFPQELRRAPGGFFASAGTSDVPWEDPELVLALLYSTLRGGTLKKLGMNRQNRQNHLVTQISELPP
jgi:hypothetical protein